MNWNLRNVIDMMLIGTGIAVLLAAASVITGCGMKHTVQGKVDVEIRHTFDDLNVYLQADCRANAGDPGCYSLSEPECIKCLLHPTPKPSPSPSPSI